MLSPPDRDIYIALHSLAGMTRVQLQQLTHIREEKQLGWAEIWKAKDEQWQAWGVHSSGVFVGRGEFLRRFSPATYAEWLVERRYTPILATDAEYPWMLAQTPDFPLALYVQGQYQLWQKTGIAVVGTRCMTAYGQSVTQFLVSDLARAWREYFLLPLVIVSGFMTGVDLTAHRAAVDQDIPSIAVLGCGLEHTIPANAVAFRQEFLKQGNAVVSEFAPLAPALKHHFLQRNRIIAGLSSATVVVEATQQSGSLHTARIALSYDRVVGAVPGVITSQFSDGARHLIQEGGVLVASADDILQHLAEYWWRLPVPKGSPMAWPQTLAERLAAQVAATKDPVAVHVWREIAAAPRTIDEILELTGQSLSTVMTAVSHLEIEGLIEKDGDKILARACTMGASQQWRKSPK